MVTFARCEQEAGAILGECLRDAAYRRRLMDSGSAWGWDFPAFLRSVRALVAIALFSAYRAGEDQTPAEAAARGLRLLREGDAVGLFGVLPAEVGENTGLVRWLRLISIGLTNRSALMWFRLAVTAQGVLNPDTRTRWAWLLITGAQNRARPEHDEGGRPATVTVTVEDPPP
ncbi:hypothetical protein ACIP98_04095 [Streptomyces sp. NPDC088354]|uniref:hypothetical protein n=1 Tax=unclassified Streptomyces TaxID=2593676 RepID=UPI0029A50851|nr:hypothetical protein [Streptomyces sp. MI02-7b]MDX3070820.1 hypothetical protein [Streptomyces sp. MI02-7b]